MWFAPAQSRRSSRSRSVVHFQCGGLSQFLSSLSVRATKRANPLDILSSEGLRFKSQCISNRQHHNRQQADSVDYDCCPQRESEPELAVRTLGRRQRQGCNESDDENEADEREW